MKEKILAAHRAGIRTVILRGELKNLLEDVPAAVRDVMTFHLADSIGEVLRSALEEVPEGASRFAGQWA